MMCSQCMMAPFGLLILAESLRSACARYIRDVLTDSGTSQCIDMRQTQLFSKRFLINEKR